MFTVPEGKSFKCDSGITEYLTNTAQGIVKMELKEMRINAFRTADDGTEYEPGNYHIPYLSPISISYVIYNIPITINCNDENVTHLSFSFLFGEKRHSFHSLLFSLYYPSSIYSLLKREFFFSSLLFY